MFWIYPKKRKERKKNFGIFNKNQFQDSLLICIFHVLYLFDDTDLIYAELNTSSIPSTSKSNQGTPFSTGPYLDGNGISNVTTQIGTHAYLPCKVSN